MKIISNFKDYYDTARYGSGDEKILYIRRLKLHSVLKKYKELLPEFKILTPLAEIYWEMPEASDIFRRAVIAFCGKAYPVYVTGHDEIRGCYSHGQVTTETQALPRGFSGRASLLEDLLCRPTKRKKKGIWDGARDYGDPYLTPRSWHRFTEITDFSLPDEMFRRFNSPVLVFGEVMMKNTLLKSEPSEYLYANFCENPLLKDYDFARVMDPHTAYQELAMYVGNNLVTQKDPNVDIPDTIRAESHGFDKYSFRNHKRPKGDYHG